MSYIHDLTTTALNLIDAKKTLDFGGSSLASLSERTVLTDVLKILNQCESIPSCDISVLENAWSDRDRIAMRGQVSEEIWYLLSAANEGLVDDGNPASLVDRAITLCIADQPGSA